MSSCVCVCAWRVPAGIIVHPHVNPLCATRGAECAPATCLLAARLHGSTNVELCLVVEPPRRLRYVGARCTCVYRFFSNFKLAAAPGSWKHESADFYKSGAPVFLFFEKRRSCFSRSAVFFRILCSCFQAHEEHRIHSGVASCIRIGAVAFARPSRRSHGRHGRHGHAAATEL